MRELLKNRNLLALCGAIISSTTGSWLLIYAFSTSLYLETGSLVASSLVFFCKIAPSAFAGVLAGNMADRSSPKDYLRVVNLCSFALTLLYFLPLRAHSYNFLYLLIGLRSFFDHAETMGREVSVVCYFQERQRLKANTIINTSNLVSMALAGAIGIYLFKVISLYVFIALDAVTFLVSAAILSLLPAIQGRSQVAAGSFMPTFKSLASDTKAAWREIRSNAMIKDAIAYGATFGIFLEGSRVVLHHYMGMAVYKIGASGIGMIVSIESLGMIVGGLLTGILADWLIKGHLKLVALTFLVGLSYALQICAPGIGAYLVLVFCTSAIYQMFDIHTINMMIASCPPSLLGKVSGLWIKFFALPAISIVSVIAAGVIPTSPPALRTAMFVILPMLIIASWECFKAVKRRNPHIKARACDMGVMA